MPNPAHILVIRFSSLGDIVLTSPVTRALRQRYPDATISIVVKQGYAPIATLLPGVDHVIGFDPAAGLSSLLARIRAAPPDLVIDLHANGRSRLLSLCSGAPHVIRYRKRRLARMGMVYLKRLQISSRHTVDQYLHTLDTLGLPPAARQPELLVREDARMSVANLLRAEGIRDDQVLIGFAPGASTPTKRWPVRHFAALADQLCAEGHAIPVLIGGVHDMDVTRVMGEAMRTRSIDWGGKVELALLPATLARCHLVVSNDSGPMHIAAAVGVAVVGVFGPTHPMLGFAPISARATTVSLETPCSPCSLHGARPCWKDTRECLEHLTVEYVINAAERVTGMDDIRMT